MVLSYLMQVRNGDKIFLSKSSNSKRINLIKLAYRYVFSIFQKAHLHRVRAPRRAIKVEEVRISGRDAGRQGDSRQSGSFRR